MSQTRPGDARLTESPSTAPEDAANVRAAAATRSPENRAATDAHVAAALQGAPASGTDTEYLRDPDAAGPITQHGADGPSAAAGRPVHRPNQTSAGNAPLEIRPLRTLFLIEPFGLPIQFWIGAVLMLGILFLLFVVG